MTNKKKWLSFGVAGAVGLTLVGGAAAATAASMDLRTGDGSVVPGGAVVGAKTGVLDSGTVQMRATDTSASVLSTPSPVAPSPATPASPVSVVSAPSPVPPPAPAPAAPVPAPEPPAPAPVPVDSPASPASPASVASAGTD